MPVDCVETCDSMIQVYRYVCYLVLKPHINIYKNLLFVLREKGVDTIRN